MPRIDVVFFDVGEPIVGETREYGTFPQHTRHSEGEFMRAGEHVVAQQAGSRTSNVVADVSESIPDTRTAR